MESSETGSAAVDCSVGSIVWVRRRNGSWWPGKILGPDELSASHLMSPRSGTPVKLLGREDASVDWYNLEKSKRVKAFRCGEFDECILRAEASQGMPPKKREKYARREDAILHALELERQLLEKKSGKLGYSSNGERSKSVDAGRKELVASAGFTEKGSANHLDSQPSQFCGKHGVASEQEKTGHILDEGIVKEGYKINEEDESSGAVSSVRGLHDVLMTAPVVQSLPFSNVTSRSLDIFSGNFTPGIGPGSEVTVDANSDSLFKRHDKHLPLAHVLQNSAKISHAQPNVDSSISISRGELDDVECPAKRSRFSYLSTESGNYLSEKKVHSGKIEIPAAKLDQGSSADLYGDGTSDSAEDTETDSSGPETTESDTDEDMSALSDGAASIGLEPKYPERLGLYAEYGSTSSEELDEFSLTDDTSDSYYDIPAVASGGVSKWQLKGRRNDRGFIKRCRDGTDQKLSGGSIYGPTVTERGSSYRHKSYPSERSLRTRMAGYGSRGFDGVSNDVNTWQNPVMNDQPTVKGYWEESEESLGHTYAGQRHTDGKLMLIDVDLKVQASYQRPPVPLISLTSKLNGHAIVGHPIQIEVLESGLSETIFAASDDYYPGISDYSTTLPPVWRTARRTANSRVPRSQPSSALDSDESTLNVQVGDYPNRKILLGRSNAGTSGFKVSMAKNSIATSQADRRFSRKQPKRISLSGNQKIRTLSSIASQHKQIIDLKRGGHSYQVGGLIKPDSISVPTAVACIPVKLVFSRLQEELVGRHQ